MGVIRKNDPKLGIFASSEESLNLPDTSDDDNASSVNEVPVPLPSHVPRHIRGRILPVPMTFGTLRKRPGKRRSRRIENMNQLMTLVEDEELDEVTIYDFIPRSNDAFRRLLEDSKSLEAWHNFIQSSEEVQNMICLGKEFHTRSRSIYISKNPNDCLSGEQAFRNIKTGLRNVLKKNKVPLGMLEYLERELVDFFSKMPQETYVSPSSLSSFERLLLHAVSQYHRLISHSFDCDDTRVVKIFNPYKLYQSPEVLLGKYLENKRKVVNTVN